MIQAFILLVAFCHNYLTPFSVEAGKSGLQMFELSSISILATTL